MNAPLGRLAAALDRRFGRDANPPSVWPIGVGTLLSHAAVAAFVLLVLTGLLLTVAYRPSVDPVVYDGASELYAGQELPGAFASVIRISEDLPGGLLLRRVHVAAAHLLLLALVAHLLRTMATGAFRRPRLLTHLTGVGLLLVSLGFAYTGELLPFGLVSGSSLRIAESVLYSLPLAGEQLGTLLFDGELPSQRFLTIAWVGHVVLLPLAFVGLLAWHGLLVHRRGPALSRRDDVDVQLTAVGRPLWPDAALRFSFLAVGLAALLLLSAAIVPWSDLELEGPFLTAEATNSVHPHWSLFFLTGGLRIIPAIDIVIGGVRITNVFVAGVLVPGILVGALTLYPFLERRVLRDDAEHHRLDHPLQVPFRAGAVTALTTFALVLTIGGAVDVIAFWLRVPVEGVVLTFQVLLVVLPAAFAALAVVAARHRADRLAAEPYATTAAGGPDLPDRSSDGPSRTPATSGEEVP
jgi:quinol-cytochrome oxidoreductase complex cytochrome b subunit